METKIKEIIAPFLNVDPEVITAQTALNRNTLKSSIHLHRMYAKLHSNGFIIDDYSNISTFGELLDKLNVITTAGSTNLPQVANANNALLQSNLQVGIDVEVIAAMPVTSDFRNHEFYQLNFSAEEISYCVLQQNPYASFAGLFATKEALIKSNNSIAGLPFNTININHDNKGKPVYYDYSISISHTDQLAIAVVISSFKNELLSHEQLKHDEVQFKGNNTYRVLSVLAILISVFTLLLLLFKL